jgi:hypothetical protein
VPLRAIGFLLVLMPEFKFIVAALRAMLLLSFPVRVPSTAIRPVPVWMFTGSKNVRLEGILTFALLSERPISIELNPF